MTVTSEKIASLGAELLHYESRIKATEQTLANLKEIYRHLVEVNLPKAMDAAEMSEFRVSDGLGIIMGMDIHASVPKSREAEAHEWGKSRQGFETL